MTEVPENMYFVSYYIDQEKFMEVVLDPIYYI